MVQIVYVMRALPGDALARLGAESNGTIVIRGGRPTPPPLDELAVEAAGATVLVPSFLDRVDDQLLARLPAVHHVASFAVGTDHIDLEACARRGLLVTNTPGVLTETTADLTWALILATARRVCEGDRLIRAGGWRKRDVHLLHGTDVHGKTLGIIGFGRIGQAVARRAVGFSMNVIYSSPREAGFAGASRVGLETLLGQSDFVSIHCPLTAATRGLLGRDHLQAMKPGAILINTARGPVIDEDALIQALTEGPLGGAGIDVFWEEPRVPERLRALDNVVLLPHLGSATRETRAGMTQVVADEIARVAKGEAPRFPVLRRGPSFG